MSFAKGVNSGYVPLGGVVVGSAVRAPLEADPSFMFRHGFTYSGHPAACAAALKAMEIAEREGLVARAITMGARLEAGLRSLVADGIVASMRGDVAVWAVTLLDGVDPVVVRDRMLSHGVITRALPPGFLTFCPPLVTTDAQIDRIVDALAASAR